MDELLDLLDRWETRRIAVVGDFMLDRFIYGNAERLSPDAPVPVLAAERREHSPGGASNVCLDLRALRCEVEAFGVVGDDVHGVTLRETLEAAGVGGQGLIVEPDRPTTVKHNFIGLAQHRHPQKMFRVDEESRRPIQDRTSGELIKSLAGRIEEMDLVCLEDYHKGVCTPELCQAVIEMGRAHGVRVFVDPAAISDFSRYRGATLITPNRIEAERATDHAASSQASPDALTPIAERLAEQLGLDHVVLTLDRHGMLLATPGEETSHVPTQAREVYDVTGAGDMVLAMLAAASAQGASLRHAAQLANVAAGLEVERFGVVPITLDEVMLVLLASRRHELGKVRTLEQLLPELGAYRRSGRTIGFTNGCFDILHAGHVAYLRRASEEVDLLVVAVNSDASIGRIKGGSDPSRPVNPQDDRVLVLSELSSVDYVIVFEQDTPERLIRAISPHALIKGADYTREQVVGHEFVEAAGGRVVLVPLVEGRSTTGILERARGGAPPRRSSQTDERSARSSGAAEAEDSNNSIDPRGDAHRRSARPDVEADASARATGPPAGGSQGEAPNSSTSGISKP